MSNFKLLEKVDMEQINACLSMLLAIRASAERNKKTWGWELALADFAKAMACLNPQSYGSRVENRLSEILGLLKSDDKNRGDKKTNKGEYIEWKGSFFTSSNVVLNIVQIRPWQDTNYIFYSFDMRYNDVKIQLFYLSKIQMELEMSLCQVGSAHGTKECNKNNANKELALRIEVDDTIYNRWIKEYGLSLDDLIHKLNDFDISSDGG